MINILIALLIYFSIASFIFYSFKNADRRWHFFTQEFCYLMALSWPLWIPISIVNIIKTTLRR
jgi:hypothetical protein